MLIETMCSKTTAQGNAEAPLSGITIDITPFLQQILLLDGFDAAMINKLAANNKEIPYRLAARKWRAVWSNCHCEEDTAPAGYLDERLLLVQDYKTLTALYDPEGMMRVPVKRTLDNGREMDFEKVASGLVTNQAGPFKDPAAQAAFRQKLAPLLAAVPTAKPVIEGNDDLGLTKDDIRILCRAASDSVSSIHHTGLPPMIERLFVVSNIEEDWTKWNEIPTDEREEIAGKLGEVWNKKLVKVKCSASGEYPNGNLFERMVQSGRINYQSVKMLFDPEGPYRFDINYILNQNSPYERFHFTLLDFLALSLRRAERGAIDPETAAYIEEIYTQFKEWGAITVQELKDPANPSYANRMRELAKK